jgi:hypothetical protein
MRKAIGMTILLFALSATQAFAQRYVVFPQFASGLGWESELFFNNQGTSDIYDIRVYFYSSTGAAQTVPTTAGTGTSIPFNLQAGATKVIELIPSTTRQEGYIVVRYPSANTAIRATEVYRYEQNGVVQAEVGVQQQEYANHFSFPVEMNSAEQIKTVIALANPAEYNPSGPVAQTVILNLIRMDGTVEATVNVPLLPGRQLADYLDEPGLFEDLDDFVGTMSVSSPLGVGVLALRQDKQAFGAISTDYGPVLAPYMLSSVITPLPEPNDTPAQAPPITNSIVLSGAIGSAGDLDYVKFTGNQGDVISVVCDTQAASSRWDSVIELYDGSLNLIASNNQNGLSPQLSPSNDSFIHMVLPSDGTYYLLVKDYNGNGGGGYSYLLHVKLP